MRYSAIIEKAGDNWCAFSPDVPLCLSTGDTPEDALEGLREALTMHLRYMRDGGVEIPRPVTLVGTVEVELSA